MKISSIVFYFGVLYDGIDLCVLKVNVTKFLKDFNNANLNIEQLGNPFNFVANDYYLHDDL